MNLEGILAISGKPGLYKLIGQTKGGFIVQSLADDKRFPVAANNSVSALEDIAIYTYSEEVPLKEVFRLMAEKYDEGAAIGHKESANKLAAALEEVLPDYDQERVYPSDLKKLFQWYNLLAAAGLVSKEVETEEENAEESATEE